MSDAGDQPVSADAHARERGSCCAYASGNADRWTVCAATVTSMPSYPWTVSSAS
ncbi:Uncharacterised protein [Mycobacteroides abscessus]|nr:Uncharacterised protein [Mycobacteroides abscessus]